MRKKLLKNIFRITTAAILSISLLFPATPFLAVSESIPSGQYNSIDGLSGEILYDTNGERVMACGGEVRQFTENGITKWYWFGVDDLDKADDEESEAGIHLYSSFDLYNWDYEGIIWNIQGAHPKLLYNEAQKQYVMWISTDQGLAVGTSSSIQGPFTLVSSSNTNDIQGFINLYEESPGTAYIIYSGSGLDNSFSLAQLSSDYQRIEGTPQPLQFEDISLTNAEGGIFKRNGSYYIVNAGMTQYATADSLTGTWKVSTLSMWDGTNYKTIVNKNQTSDVFHVKTETTDEYICVGDSVGGETNEVRYIWLPIAFLDNGTIALMELSNWQLEGIDPGNTEVMTPYDSIHGLADETLYDTEGREIRACGGEVHQFTENGVTKWYWFGENVSPVYSGGASTVHNLHLYSSTDLYNWTREEDIFKGMTSKEQFETDDYFKALYGDLNDTEKDVVFECLKDCPTAHPKVLYNEKTQQYVMWVPGSNGKQCIATSNSIKGPFKFIKHCEDISGFITMYQESNGTAYIIFQDDEDVSIALLTDDYMDIKGATQPLFYRGNTKLVSAQGSIIKQNGKYYMVNAGTKQYAVANSLTGTWAVHSLLLTDSTEQLSLNPTSCILPVNTKDGVIYINISDSWNADTTDKVRYVWLPIQFYEDGTITLQNLSHWKLGDMNPGELEPSNPEKPGINNSIAGLSGEILYDTDSNPIYACGGEVHQVTENDVTKWYWFGVNDLEPEGQLTHPGIHLYSSLDLYNWKYEGTMGNFGNDISIAHPKVLYNEKQQQYVMWLEWDGSGMKAAVSKSIKGPFTIVDGAGANEISGFINLYKDSDGTAYIIYGSRSSDVSKTNGLFIAKLSDDYTRIDGNPHAFQYTYDSGTLFNAEGGIFERNGKYYIINAGNPDNDGPQYATANSINGPWTVEKMQMWDHETQEFENIVNKNQTSHVFHLKTETADTYVCVGDSVGGDTEKARYIWLPIKFFEDGTIALEKLNNWKPDREIPDVTIDVEAIALSDTNKTMKIGETYPIAATVSPANATNQTLTYKSSNDSVASVSVTGIITAKRAGSATITVTSVNGITARLQVTVEAAPEKKIEVQKVLVATNRKTIGVGEKFKLKAAVYPMNARSTKLTYHSSNNKVTVNENGVVTAKKTGTCEITISSSNHKTAVVTITVKKKPGKIRLNAKEKTLKAGKKFQIKPKLPKGTASNKITYTSNRKSIASVSKKGKVTAKKKGTAVITVKTYNGKKATLKIHVK